MGGRGREEGRESAAQYNTLPECLHSDWRIPANAFKHWACMHACTCVGTHSQRTQIALAEALLVDGVDLGIGPQIPDALKVTHQQLVSARLPL